MPRADLTVSLALGGYGTASGEGVCAGVVEKRPPAVRLVGDGDNGDGERGDLGDGLGDFRPTKRNLDGDLESDLRIDLTAEVTST